MKYQLTMHLCRAPGESRMGPPELPREGEVFHTENISFEAHDDLEAKQDASILRDAIGDYFKHTRKDEGGRGVP